MSVSIWKRDETITQAPSIWTKRGVREILSATDVLQREVIPRAREYARYVRIKELVERVNKEDLPYISEKLNSLMSEFGRIIEETCRDDARKCYEKIKQKFPEVSNAIENELNKVFKKYYGVYPRDIINEVKQKFREAVITQTKKIELGINPLNSFNEILKKRSEVQEKYRKALTELADAMINYIRENISAFNFYLNYPEDENLKNETRTMFKCYGNFIAYAKGKREICPECPEMSCELCLQVVFEYFSKYKDKLDKFNKNFIDYIKKTNAYKNYESTKPELTGYDVQLYSFSNAIADYLKTHNISLNSVAKTLLNTISSWRYSLTAVPPYTKTPLAELLINIEQHLRRSVDKDDAYSFMLAIKLIKENESRLKYILSSNDWKLVNDLYEKLSSVKLEVSPEALVSEKEFLARNVHFFKFIESLKHSQESVSKLSLKTLDIDKRLEPVNLVLKNLEAVTSYINNLVTYINNYSETLSSYLSTASNVDKETYNSIISELNLRMIEYESMYKELSPHVSELQRLISELNNLFNRTDLTVAEKLRKQQEIISRINTLISIIERYRNSIYGLTEKLKNLQKRFDSLLDKAVKEIREVSQSGNSFQIFGDLLWSIVNPLEWSKIPIHLERFSKVVDVYLKNVTKDPVVASMNQDFYNFSKSLGPAGALLYILGSGFILTYSNIKTVGYYASSELAKLAEQQTNPILKNALRLASGMVAALTSYGLMLIPGINVIMAVGGISELAYTGVKRPEYFTQLGQSIAKEPGLLLYIAPSIALAGYSVYKGIRNWQFSSKSLKLAGENVPKQTVETIAKLSKVDENTIDDFINFMKIHEPKAYKEYVNILNTKDKVAVIQALGKLEENYNLVSRYAIVSSIVSTLGKDVKISKHALLPIIDRAVKETLREYSFSITKISPERILEDLKTLGMLKASASSDFIIAVNRALKTSVSKIQEEFLKIYHHIELVLENISKTVATNIKPIAKSFLRTLRESFSKLVHVAYLEEALGLVNVGMHRIVEYVAEFTRNLEGFFRQIVAPIHLYWLAANVYAKMYGSIEKALDIVMKLGSKAFDVLKTVSVKSIEITIKFEDFLKMFFTKFRNEVEKISSFMSKTGQAIVEKMKNFVMKVEKYIEDLLAKAGSKMNELFEKLDNKLGLSKFYEKLMSRVDKAVSEIEKGVEKTKMFSEEAFEKIKGVVRTKLVEMKSRVKTQIDRVMKPIKKIKRRISHEIKMRTSREYELKYGEKPRIGEYIVSETKDGQIEITLRAYGKLGFKPTSRRVEKFEPKITKRYGVYEEETGRVFLGKDVEQTLRVKEGGEVYYIRSYVARRDIINDLKNDEILREIFEKYFKDFEFKPGKVIMRKIPIEVSYETRTVKPPRLTFQETTVVEKLAGAFEDGRAIQYFSIKTDVPVREYVKIPVEYSSLAYKFDASGFLFEHGNKLYITFRTSKGSVAVGIVNPSYGRELVKAFKLNDVDRVRKLVAELLPKYTEDINNVLSGGKPIFFDFVMEVLPEDFQKILNKFLESVGKISQDVKVVSTTLPKRFIVFTKTTLSGKTTMIGEGGTIDFYDTAVINVRKPFFREPKGEYLIQTKVTFSKDLVSKIAKELGDLENYLSSASPDELVDALKNIDLLLFKKLSQTPIEKIAFKDAVNTFKDLIKSLKESLEKSMKTVSSKQVTQTAVKSSQISRETSVVSQAVESVSRQTVPRAVLKLSPETKQLIDTASIIYGLVDLSEVDRAVLQSLKNIVIYVLPRGVFEISLQDLLSSIPLVVTTLVKAKLVEETETKMREAVPPISVSKVVEQIAEVKQLSKQEVKTPSYVVEIAVPVIEYMQKYGVLEREEALLKYVLVTGGEEVGIGSTTPPVIRIPISFLPFLPNIVSALKGYASPEEIEELLSLLYQYEELEL
ncbi:MAG: hypothetical protein QXX12_00715 [Nanopusillaceae archaeon]